MWNCFRKLFLSSKTEKGTKQVLSVCRTVYKFCAFNYSWYLFPVMAWLEMRMHLWIQSAPRIWSSDGKQKLVPASMQTPWLLILTGKLFMCFAFWVICVCVIFILLNVCLFVLQWWEAWDCGSVFCSLPWGSRRCWWGQNAR